MTIISLSAPPQITISAAEAINGLFTTAQANLTAASQALQHKGASFHSLQRFVILSTANLLHSSLLTAPNNRACSELTDCYFEKRSRDEEVVNWSYILKYLLSSNSNLKKELRAIAAPGATATEQAPVQRRRSHFVDMSDAIFHNTRGRPAYTQPVSQSVHSNPSTRRLRRVAVGGERVPQVRVGASGGGGGGGGSSR